MHFTVLRMPLKVYAVTFTVFYTIGQGRHTSRSAASDLCWQATRGWPHSERLQHPEGVDPSPGSPSPWRLMRRPPEERVTFATNKRTCIPDNYFDFHQIQNMAFC